MKRPRVVRDETTASRGMPIRRTAMVLGDGTIMPIVETLGRRLIREVDPLSAKGRRLLGDGRVTLCWEDGVRMEARPVADVLDTLQTNARTQRDAGPPHQAWTLHHNRVIRSIGRMKRILKSPPRG